MCRNPPCYKLLLVFFAGWGKHCSRPRDGAGICQSCSKLRVPDATVESTLGASRSCVDERAGALASQDCPNKPWTWLIMEVFLLKLKGVEGSMGVEASRLPLLLQFRVCLYRAALPAPVCFWVFTWSAPVALFGPYVYQSYQIEGPPCSTNNLMPRHSVHWVFPSHRKVHRIKQVLFNCKYIL